MSEKGFHHRVTQRAQSFKNCHGLQPVDGFAFLSLWALAQHLLIGLKPSVGHLFQNPRVKTRGNSKKKRFFCGKSYFKLY